MADSEEKRSSAVAIALSRVKPYKDDPEVLYHIAYSAIAGLIFAGEAEKVADIVSNMVNAIAAVEVKKENEKDKDEDDEQHPK